MGSVAVVIPAYDEEERVARTVAAARTLADIDVVVIVDDGSTDGTAAAAHDAGAVVVRHSRRRGKGAAMTTGAAEVTRIEHRDGRDTPYLLLFLDADLADSAAHARPVVVPVLNGAADMAIGLLPRTPPAGGRGFVVRLSRRGIERATGWRATQPLSGQRCLTRAAFDRALPLAAGFGVETALTIDVLRAGGRVVEIPTQLSHRVTGNDVGGQLHRLRQYADVARALVARGVRHRARGASS